MKEDKEDKQLKKYMHIKRHGNLVVLSEIVLLEQKKEINKRLIIFRQQYILCRSKEAFFNYAKNNKYSLLLCDTPLFLRKKRTAQ